MPSTVRDSLQALLVDGLAQQLADWDVVSYEPTGEYDPIADFPRPVYFGPDEPANAPAERVLLTVRTPLTLASSSRSSTVDVPVGINWRGPEGGDQLAAANFLGLLSRRFRRMGKITLGTIPVNGVRLSSAGTIGRDSRRRQGATATYLFRCREASANS